MDDMTICIDTREQSPFLFKNTDTLVVHKKLDYADYSLLGFEHDIAIERKSVSDFLGSISSDRERFKRELEGMKCYSRKYIVVEGPLSECMGPCTIKRKKVPGHVRPGNIQMGMNPNAVYQSMVAIGVLYNIHFYFALNREDAERFTLSTLRKYYGYKRDGKL